MAESDTPAQSLEPAPPRVGVGPHPVPWPDDDRLDPELLAEGDRRNVGDEYRYWSMDAIRADLDQRRHPIHLAVENWEKDLNLGSIVRTANAFLVAEVHIVGEKRWNRRGAMVTDRYQHVRHHPSIAAFGEWCDASGLPVLGIDIIEGSKPIETYDLPRECIMFFGQEGPGMSAEAQSLCNVMLHISQFGSTRSINASAAAAVAMHAWIRRHEFGQIP
ncbi:MAG: TrmH family RNA methyltransferase [Candidatus Nanopelagicales bacterium]